MAFDISGYMSLIVNIGMFIPVIILFIVINYFVILKKVIYPIGASIYVHREGGDVLEFARIKKKNDHGIDKWKFFGFKRRKQSCEPYEYALMSDKKGKPYIHLKQFNDNTFLPILPPTGDKREFEILNADVINWGINESNAINQEYTNMGWKEIAMIAAPVVMIAICVFCVIYSLDIQKQVTEMMVGSVNNAKQSQQPQQQYISQEVKTAPNLNGIPPV